MYDGPDCTHFGQVVNCFESMIHTLAEKCCKFTIIEDLKRAARWDFAHCAGMETMAVIAVARLNKNSAVR